MVVVPAVAETERFLLTNNSILLAGGTLSWSELERDGQERSINKHQPIISLTAGAARPGCVVKY